MISDADQAELSCAVRLAAVAHEHQRDKEGVAYILHPLRVLFSVSERARVAAVLHDVIEDCDYSVERLVAEGVSRVNAEAVDLLSRRPGMTYENFIERLVDADGKPGEVAREVKIADLRDNLGRMTPQQRQAWPKAVTYEAALRTLGAPWVQS